MRCLEEQIAAWETMLRRGTDGTNVPKSPSSLARYRSALCTILRKIPDEGDLVDAFVAFLDDLQGHAAHTTHKMYRQVAKTFLASMRLGTLEELREILPRPPRKRQSAPRVPPDSDVYALIEHDWGPRDNVMFRLMAHNGLRISEVARARWQYVEWDDSRLWIHESKYCGERYAPLSAKTLAALRELHQLCTDSPWLFPNRTNSGRPVSTEIVRKALRRAWQTLGVTRPHRPHSLRHWFAVRVHRSGVSLRALQALLGHGTPETTCIYIQHITQADVVDSYNGVDWEA